MKKHLIILACILVFTAIVVTIVYFVNEHDKKLDTQKVSFTLVLRDNDDEIREPKVRTAKTNLLDALKAFSKEQKAYFPLKYDKKNDLITEAGHITADDKGKILVYHNLTDETLYDKECGEETCDIDTCKNVIILGDVYYRLSSKKLSELPIVANGKYLLTYIKN